MRGNTIKKFLNNKHLIAIMIICLIAMTCISFASAADVNENPVNNTDLDDSIVVNFNNETVTDSVIDDQAVSNDTQPDNNSINWEDYNVNIDDYKNPTVLHINTVDDLHKAASQVYLAKQNNIDLIMLVFDNNEIYSINPWFQHNLLNPTCKMLIIQGNGATIQIKNPDETDEYHFLNNDVQTFVSGLTLKGFNTAIVNHGILLVNDCTFDGNVLDYCFKEDYGGAIKNYGTAFLFNSIFTNNYAKFGGAIWSSAESTLYICNCTFDNNFAYAGGDDVLYKEGCTFSVVNCTIGKVVEANLLNTIKMQLKTALLVDVCTLCGGVCGGALGFFIFCDVLLLAGAAVSIAGLVIFVGLAIAVFNIDIDQHPVNGTTC